MANFAPQVIVEPPVAAPPLHGLATTGVLVTEAEERWENGFSYRTETCQCASGWHFDCGEVKPDKPDADDVRSRVDYDPFQIIGVYECGTQGTTVEEFRGIATRSLEASTTKVLEAEFWTGELVPTNPYLAMAGSVVVNPCGAATTAMAPMEAEAALAFLQEALADCCPGGRGTIHAPVSVASRWHSKAAIKEASDGRLVTGARGDYVVAGGGYPGTGPGGATPPAGSRWVFATSGLTHVRLSDIRMVGDEAAQVLNRRTNRIYQAVERTAAATWDNCCLLATLVQVTTCS